MAYDYLRADREQLFLMPVCMREWLEEGHLALFCIDVVARLDTRALDERHPNDGAGRPAYDPEMMLALLLYAYCTGMRSSRRIERACRTDAAYKVICGGLIPDHSTIARFIADQERALEGLFVSGLRLCHAAGLIDLSVLALDGSKIAADASLAKNRQAEWIRAQIKELMAQTVASEQAEAGRKLPGRKPKDPAAALARAEADYAAALARAGAKHARRQARGAEAGSEGSPVPNPAQDSAVKQAQAALKAANDRAQQEPAKPLRANITDPDSRVMSTRKGWVQGYNGQAIVNRHQIVLACQVSQDVTDIKLYQPMTEELKRTLTQAGIPPEQIELMLADAGYCSEANLTADGPTRLIATQKDHKQRAAARELGHTTGPPPEDANPIEAMEHQLRTTEGAAAYAQRSQLIEPTFGDHKHNRGYRAFRRRGLTAAQSEWAFIHLAGNLLKVYRHKRAPSATPV